MKPPGRTLFLLREGAQALRRSLRAAVLAALMTTVTIFSAGLVHSLGNGLAAIARDWARQSLLVAYLAPGAEGEAAARQATELMRSSGLVANPKLVSSAEAKRRLSELYGALAGLADEAGDQAFPASVEGSLSPASDAAAREKLIRELASIRGVDEVQYDQQWIARLEQVARNVRWGAAALLLLLGTGAALTSSGAMRLSLLSAREEIRVLRFVGATEWVIRGPYLVAGAIVGLTGSLVAVGMLVVAMSAGGRYLGRELPILPAKALPVPGLAEWLLLVGVGVAASIAGSWVASRDAEEIR